MLKRYWRRLVEKADDTERTLFGYRPERVKNSLFLKWLEKKFYPRARKREIPAADRFVGLVILFSLFYLLYELQNDLTFTLLNAVMTAFFVIFFGSEYISRLLLKGRAYASSMWGVIDAGVIFADIATLLFIFSNLNPDAISYVIIARFIRIMRVARVFKLLQYVRNWGFWSSQIDSILPYARALGQSLFYAICFVVAIVLISSSFFGADVSVSLKIFIETITSIMDLDSTASDGTGVVSQIGAVLVYFIFANIVIVIFFPQANKIVEEQRRLNPYRHLNNHIVIVISQEKDVSILEELVQVFHVYARYDIIVVHSKKLDASLFSTPFSKVYVHRGALSDPSMWSQVKAHRSRAIIIVGQHKVEAADIPVLLFAESEAENTSFRIVSLIDAGAASLTEYSQPTTGIVTEIPLEQLADQIEEKAWRSNSRVQGYIQTIGAEFDNTLSVHPSSRSQVLPEEIEAFKDALSTIDSVRVKNEDGAVLVDVHLDDNALESDYEVEEARVVSKLLKNKEKNTIFLSNVDIYFYVKTFKFISFNDELRSLFNGRISIVPIELAQSLAIFHEIELPGIIFSWLDDTTSVEYGSLDINRTKPDYLTHDEVAASIDGAATIYEVEKGAEDRQYYISQSSDRLRTSAGDIVRFYRTSKVGASDLRAKPS